MKSYNIKIGFYSIGLDTYWKQYEGLHDRLLGYHNQIIQSMTTAGADIIDGGLVDHPSQACETAELFKRNNVSLIFLYISTYALSSTVLPVVQRAGVPVVILNLQPTKAIDYKWFNNLEDRTAMTGEWLANCQACALPEISSVFNRSGIKFFQISGYLEDQEAFHEIKDWIDAALVAKSMSDNRMGFLGHYYCGMLDVYSDLTQHSVSFGTHVQILEMCNLKEMRDNVTPDEIQKKRDEISNVFEIGPGCDEYELNRAAKTAVALDKLASKYKLDSMAYYYEGTAGNEYENIVSSIIVGNSLLTTKNIPVAGEAEVKNVHAMKILDSFGAGGSFTEFYLMDFEKDELLMGHDGPGHIAIAEGKPLLRPLKEFHGKPGKGLSVEMKVKNGPVTILAVVQTRGGQLKMIYAEAFSVPGPILEIGNTNSRYKFPVSMKKFINDWCSHGPAHHCAVGVGHIGSKIEKLGYMLDMEVVKVC
jgi:L-arabinose isomerase